MFDERVLRHAPWSVSKTNLLGLCSAQFVHKYVSKLKESRKSASSRVGVVAHMIQEGELKKPGQDLLKELEEISEKEQLTSEERREVAVRLSAIADFARRVQTFKESKGVAHEFIEHQLAMTPDFKKTHFFDRNGLMRGVLDHAMITQDNVMVIIDHKSGRKKPIEEHLTQFYVYMLLAVSNFAVDGVQCGVNYIGSDKVEWSPRYDGAQGSWTRAEIESQLRDWLAHYLNKTVRKLTLIESGNVEKETGWQCEYCGYLDSCDAGQQEIERRRSKREGKINL